MTVDFGRTAADYAAHRAGFPGEFFGRLRPYGVGLAGQRVADTGTGTGNLARGFAAAGCAVTGLDIAPELLAEARQLDRAAGVRVRDLVASAERTGLAPGRWDVVSAGQCWHWFDRPRAAAEARRLLAPGGRLLICYFSYLALPGNVCAASEELVLARNPSWAMAGDTGIHPEYTIDVAQAGFTGIETFSFDVLVPYTHTAWRGRMRTCNGVGASLPDDQVARYDANLAAVLAERFGNEPMQVPHRAWALIARAPLQ
jgi:SAM-dependent methyltransferase